MKKYVFSAVCAIFLSTFSGTLSAQTKVIPRFGYGLCAGASYSSLTLSDVKSTAANGTGTLTRKYASGDAVLGFHAGMFARFRFLKFGVQPEVLFSHTGGNIEVTDPNNSQALGDVQRVNFSRLDVPLMFNWYPMHFLRLQLGPVGSYNLSAKINEETIPDAQTMSWGWQTGLGIDVERVFVNLKYENSLSRLQNNYFKTQGATFKQGNQQFILSVCYNLM
jgi:hypothetical protein